MSGGGGDDRGRCQQLGQAGRGSRVSYLPVISEQGILSPYYIYGSKVCYLPIISEQGGIIFLVCGSRIYHLPIISEQGVLYPYYVGARCSISLLYGIYVPIA